MEGLKLIGNYDWERTFEGWRINEEQQEGWQKIAREKGWENWEQWRKYLAELLRLPTRKWQLYEIEHPEKVLPDFFIGPFQGWQSSLPAELQNNITFAELLEIERKKWETHSKVVDLVQDFPINTHLTGLILPTSKKIVCVEGSHRSMAAAVARFRNIKLRPAQIALAEMTEDENGLLAHILKTGTHKPS